MSLINDALKRARHEALRQEAETGRPGYRAVPAHSRRSARPWLPFAAGVAVAVVLLGGWMLWPRSHSEGEAAAESVPVEPGAVSREGAAAPPESRQAGTDPQRVVETSPVVIEEEASRSLSGDAPDSAAPPLTTETAPPSTEGAKPVAAVTEDAPAPASPPPATQQPTAQRLEPGAVYLRRATAADGSQIELGGIVYSDTRPIAVINGSVVAPGDMVSGFTVIAIEPKRVELETDGVRFFLALP